MFEYARYMGIETNECETFLVVRKFEYARYMGIETTVKSTVAGAPKVRVRSLYGY